MSNPCAIFIDVCGFETSYLRMLKQLRWSSKLMTDEFTVATLPCCYIAMMNFKMNVHSHCELKECLALLFSLF